LEPFSHPYEPLSYHNPIQRWIEKSSGNVSWHDSLLPSHPLEHDSIFDSVLEVIPTHDYFVLDIFWLWFIIKHKGRNFEFDQMLGWIHWLYDYT
jgi:hypothetical protein